MENMENKLSNEEVFEDSLDQVTGGAYSDAEPIIMALVNNGIISQGDFAFSRKSGNAGVIDLFRKTLASKGIYMDYNGFGNNEYFTKDPKKGTKNYFAAGEELTEILAAFGIEQA